MSSIRSGCTTQNEYTQSGRAAVEAGAASPSESLTEKPAALPLPLQAAQTTALARMATEKKSGRRPGAERARCTAVRKNGQPCRAPAFHQGPDGLICAQHRATPAQRTEWAKRGAAVSNHRQLVKKIADAQLPQAQKDALLGLQVPDLSTAEQCLDFLEHTIAEVKAGLLPPSLANSVKGLVDSSLKIAEMKVHAQLAAMEAELHGGGR